MKGEIKMDIQKELAFLDEPEWVMAAYELAVDNGDLETANKILDAHPEIIDYIEAWCKANGIELP